MRALAARGGRPSWLDARATATWLRARRSGQLSRSPNRILPLIDDASSPTTVAEPRGVLAPRSSFLLRARERIHLPLADNDGRPSQYSEIRRSETDAIKRRTWQHRSTVPFERRGL